MPYPQATCYICHIYVTLLMYVNCMAVDFLEPDRSTRNLIIFIVALFICIAFYSFHFIADRGCVEYSQNLQKCEAFQCSQRVMGFENERAGHSPAIITRKIIGWEQDKYFDTQTCNVVESDNIEGDSSVLCKYSNNTLNIAVTRSGILFGNAPLPGTVPPGSNTDSQRAVYAQRTTEQNNECVKQ